MVDNKVMSLTPTCFFLKDSFQSALTTALPPAAFPLGSWADAPDLAVFFPALLEMAYSRPASCQASWNVRDIAIEASACSQEEDQRSSNIPSYRFSFCATPLSVPIVPAVTGTVASAERIASACGLSDTCFKATCRRSLPREVGNNNGQERDSIQS